MGEHSARYGELAHALNDAGFNVLAPDLRGHGQSLPALIEPGDMGRHGWQETLADLAFLEYWMTQENDRPAILFGHSLHQNVSIKPFRRAAKRAVFFVILISHLADLAQRRPAGKSTMSENGLRLKSLTRKV